MECVNVGIIGIGNIGSAHLKWITENKDCGMKVTAICDIDKQKAEILKEKYPDIAFFEDYKQLLESKLTQAIIVSVPHYLHPIVALEAFNYDQHVLIEKPAGVYTSKVREMNEQAKKHGKVFAIMFNQRTNSLFYKAKQIVESGQLGETKHLIWIVTNWYRTQAYYNSGSWRATWKGEGGGVLLNQAPHNLDLWQWIFGMPNKIFSFCKFGKYHNITVEDDVTIQAEYENGATATFITTTGEYPGTNRLEIEGDCGKIVIENGKLSWWKLNEKESEFRFSSQEGFYAPECEYEEFEEEQTNGHALVLQNFADAILHNTPLVANGYEGINALTISNAAYLSAWKNCWVDIPFDESEFEKYLKQKCDSETQTVHGVTKEKLSDGYQSRWQTKW